MNTTFIKRLLWPAIFIFLVLMSACSGVNQISLTPVISPTAMPSATSPLPAFTSSPTVSTPEKTPTSTIPATQTNLISVKDNASFVSENYPDNSVLKPGEKFVKTFEIKNVGTTTWTTSYVLALNATPQDALGSPSQINFPQETLPGKTLSLSLPLVAPITPGTYTVNWTLKNERSETIAGDGANLWVKIIVCDPNQPCNPPTAGGGTTASGISATLTNFASGEQSASVSFCMTLPNRNYGPAGGGSVSLKADQKTVLASSGGSLDPGCFEFEFPFSAAEFGQAQHVAVLIEQVRLVGAPNYPDEACQVARLNLMAQYPGLDFQCHYSMAGYYTNLQLPDGMTREQAQQIIFDAIEGAINGPWVLTIK